MKEVMKIVFATNNNHKLSEIRDILNEACEVKSLKEIGCDVDIPETGTTLEENALIKANYVWDHFHTNVFADDTGLEVEALNGEPGVYSARYAGGEGHDSEANIQKVLKNLDGIENRKARFRTVIAFIRKNKVTGEKEVSLVEGIVNGSITTHKKLQTKKDILPLAKQLLHQIHYSNVHPIRLMGLTVSNSVTEDGKIKTEWVQLELDFKV